MGMLSLHAGVLVFIVMYDDAGLNAGLVHAGGLQQHLMAMLCLHAGVLVFTVMYMILPV
jgi:hypothetical protein